MFRRDKPKDKAKNAEKSRASQHDASFNLDQFIARATRATAESAAAVRREADDSGREEPKKSRAPAAARDPKRGRADLQSAVDELISFDVETIKQRPDPRLEALKIRINNALEDIFSRQSKDYKTHAIWSLDTTPVSIGGAWHPLSEVREGYQKGIYEAIKMANSVLEKLEEEERARKEEEEKAVKDPRKNYTDLQCALGELKSFDVNSIRQRPDPRAKALTDRINDTFAEIFGRNTGEYQTHAIWTLDTALPITISGAWQSLSEVREGYRKGINDAITMMDSVLAKLEKDLSNQEEAHKTPGAVHADTAIGSDANKAAPFESIDTAQPAAAGFFEDLSRANAPAAKSEKDETVVSGVITQEIPEWALQTAEESTDPAEEPASGDDVVETSWSRILQESLVTEEPDHTEADGSPALTAGSKSMLDALEEKLHQFGAEDSDSGGLDPDLILSDAPGLMVIGEEEDGASPFIGDEHMEALVIDGDDPVEDKPFVECGDTLSPEVPGHDGIADGSLVLDDDDQFSLESAEEPATGRLEELERKLLDLGALECVQEIPGREDEFPTTIVLDESLEEVAAILPEPPEALFVLPEHDERLNRVADGLQDSARFRNIWDRLQDIKDEDVEETEIDLPSPTGYDPVDSAPALRNGPEGDTIVDTVDAGRIDDHAGAPTPLPALAWNPVSQIPSALETPAGKGALSCVGSCFAVVAVMPPELTDEPAQPVLDDACPDRALLFRAENHEEPYRAVIRILTWTADPDRPAVPKEPKTLVINALPVTVIHALAWNFASQIPSVLETRVLPANVWEYPETAIVRLLSWRADPDLSAVTEREVKTVVTYALPAAVLPALAWNPVSQIPSALETPAGKGALSCVGSCFAVVAVMPPELTDEPAQPVLDDACPDRALLFRAENHEEPYRAVIRILTWTADPDRPAVPKEPKTLVINALPVTVIHALAWNFASQIPSVLETRVLPANVWEYPETAIVRLLSWQAGTALEEPEEHVTAAPHEDENRHVAPVAEGTSPSADEMDVSQASDVVEPPSVQEASAPTLADESDMRADNQAETEPVPTETEEVAQAVADQAPAGERASTTEPIAQDVQTESDEGYSEGTRASHEETSARATESRPRKPEARHNPFLGVSGPAKGKSKGPTADVLDAQIAELQLRIDELKAFDIEKVKERADPKAKALGDAVNKTLAGIFGHDTYLYWQHAITSLERTLIIVGGPKPSPEQIRDAYRKGIKEAVAKLTATLESLSEKRRNLKAEGPRDVRPNIARDPVPEDDSRVVSFSRRDGPSRESTSRKPEARHNPFLGVSGPAKGKSKGPTADVLDAQIAELQLRIDELKAFDIEKVKERADPKAKALGDAVNKTLAGIFGHDTYLYWQHAITSLERTLIIVGGPKPSPEQIRDAYRKGIKETVTKLKATLESLSEKRRNLKAQAAC